MYTNLPVVVRPAPHSIKLQCSKARKAIFKNGEFSGGFFISRCSISIHDRFNSTRAEFKDLIGMTSVIIRQPPGGSANSVVHRDYASTAVL